MISFDNPLDSSSDEEYDDDDFQESNVFLNHLRKCFISIDENSFCEQAILSDLKLFNRKTREYFLKISWILTLKF